MSTRLSVVIPAHNEAKTIKRLVSMLSRWTRQPEIIVVANGCVDGTANLARQAGAIVIDLPDAVGQDVGRSIGAAAATGNVLLVLDADMLFTVPELEPFVRAVENGVDVALNQYPLPGGRFYLHPTAIAKQSVNLFLDRGDLRAASMTAVPHALSRKAVRKIGLQRLSVPPVAQAAAVLAGLNVQAVAYVPVGERNPIRRRPRQKSLQRLIIGDCQEAIDTICSERGARGFFPDDVRRREILDALDPRPADSSPFETLAIIPVKDEQTTLARLLHSLPQGLISATCVVNNGSSDGTTDVAAQFGALVKEFPDALGHDVGRAVGCMLFASDRYLFLDGDIPLGQEDVAPFVEALEEVDIALNDIDRLIAQRRRLDGVSVAKRFLNLALDRSDLGTASLTAVPHAIRSEVIETIGADSLAVPPLAQVKTALAGYRIKAVHAVNVIKRNRFRRTEHSRKYGKPLERLILGDHMEALHHLQATLGVRGFFPDHVRRRDLATAWHRHATIKYPRQGVRAR